MGKRGYRRVTFTGTKETMGIVPVSSVEQIPSHLHSKVLTN